MKGVASGVNPRRFRVICEFLWLGSGEDFLKSRIVPERIPFSTCQQLGKRDAFVGVIDGKT